MRVFFLVLLVMAGGGAGLFFPGRAAAQEVIGSAAAVRSLPRTEAARGLPVELRGVVTFAYHGPESRNFILAQDGTGIFVNFNVSKVRFAANEGLPPEQWPRITPGMELIVRGVTAPGQYAPVVSAEEWRVMGTAELPPPQPFVLSEVLTGRMDCQLLELRGVIQGVEMPSSPEAALRMELALPAGRMVVECIPPGPWDRALLLGATVRLRAVAMTFFNTRGENIGVHFVMGRASDLVVEKPAPEDPFAVPQVPLTGLQPFSPEGPDYGRVRLAGQVTLSRPGRYFYLEAEGRAVRVFTADPTRFQPGEWVLASGFIGLHQSFAELREAEVRRTGAGTLPEPPQVSPPGLMADSIRNWGSPMPEDYNGRLIAVRGTLTNVEPAPGGEWRLIVTSEGASVPAVLDAAGGAARMDSFLPGSEVRLTGICELQFPGTPFLTDFPNPTGFVLQLRSPDDIQMLRPPPWWTPRRLQLLLGSAGGLLALVLVWNFVLRRLVKQRSAQLATEMRLRDRAEIEFDATLRERTRLAADLHDTLEQALTGLAFQLDTSSMLAARAPEAGTRHLELGRQLLTRSREDLRRSIWNLRARVLDGHSFPDAIRAAAEQAAEGRPIRITVEEEGPLDPLPGFIAGNLLLLAQEAMTNAIKHAAPRSIRVGLACASRTLVLIVSDDGHGFDPAQARGLQEGHFGLQGMRERANRLDGTLRIESSPGQGTTITVEVPLPAPSADPLGP